MRRALIVWLLLRLPAHGLDNFLTDDLFDVGESDVADVGIELLAEATSKPSTSTGRRLPDIGKAKWIWCSEDPAAGSMTPPRHAWFRRTFALRELPTRATVLITADNGYDLYINGHAVGRDVGYGSAHWKSVEKYDVSNMMLEGRNAIAVRATWLGGAAGFVAALRADFNDGPSIEVRTDRMWRAVARAAGDWEQLAMDDAAWLAARELETMGGSPWGMLRYGAVGKPTPRAGSAARAATPEKLLSKPPQGFRLPEGIVFIAGDCSLNSNGRTLFRVGKSKAWTQNDIPGPSLIGRRLMVLRPAADAGPEVLFDAGDGIVGSPSVSYDGRWVHFSHLPEGDSFYRVCRISTAGGKPQQLTDGPFHDFDPVELPDGKIAFSSTRMGTYEEYHSAPARGLFTLDPASGDVQLLTGAVVFDNEPCVTADGRVAFVRADNFGERAKVETRIHVVRPDGTGGITAFGPDRPPLRYDRARAAGELPALLRNHGYGSPAPLPDGRMACISHAGLLCALPGDPAPPRVGSLGARQLCDISPMPGGRLLCTMAARDVVGVLCPDSGTIVEIYRSPDTRIHSATYLGARRRPPTLARLSRLDPADPFPSGVLVCQSVFNSRHRELDWARASAVRVYLGNGLTQRSSHSDIVHIGTEAIECGTIPLAPDGSFCAEVPADRAIAFQVVDAEGREIVNELSWIYVRPGERRSCVGCHARRQRAPLGVNGQPQAVAWTPVRLAGRLGRGRPHRFRANNAANGGALNLQLERFREVASVDLYELDRVDGPGRHAEVRRLIAQLRSGRPERRSTAAHRLAIHRDRNAVPSLCRALRDGSRQVRLSAAVALGACGDRTAVSALLDALGDPDPLVAQAVHSSMSNITGQRVPFRPSAPPGRRGENEWRARLGEGWEKIEAELIRAADSSAPLQRRRAVVALGHIGSAAGAAALEGRVAQRAFSDDIRTSLEAIRALGYLRHTPAVPLLARLLHVHRRPTPQRSASPKTKPARPAARSVLSIGDLSDTSEGLDDGLSTELLQAVAKPPPNESARPQRPRRKHRPNTIACHRAAAAAEALGRIGAAVPTAVPEIEVALSRAFQELGAYSTYCGLYGDHSALHACHASPMHYRIAEALDAMGSTNVAHLVPNLLRAMPTDPDRGLLLECDAVERVTGRVVARSGRADEVVQACLAVLGDAATNAAPDLRDAVAYAPSAWAGNPRGEARAAQVLSAVCVDARHGPRVLTAFERYRERPPAPLTGKLGNPRTLPTGHWAAFYLARALGRMRFAGAVDALIAALSRSSPETTRGRPEAPSVHVLYVHNTMTPIWRAAVADALGRIGDRRAVRPLMRVVRDLDNATDVRAAAARALGRIADPDALHDLQALARDYPEISTRRELLAAVVKSTPHVSKKDGS